MKASAILGVVVVLAVAAGTEAQVRLLQSTSGTKGSIKGTRYVIEDPRTAFRADEDRQVVVYFEWDGAPGTHECLARWKDPTGAVVLAAPYQVKASTRRFGVFWTLALPEGVRTGLWAVETEVDGVQGGVHTFQIEAGGGPDRPPSRPVPTLEETYDLARRVTLEIQALDARGGMLRVGSGMPLADGVALTDFEVIDGAARIRIVSPNGAAPIETDEVLGFDKRQAWAALKAPSLSASGVLLCRTCVPKLGDRYKFLFAEESGATMLSETGVAGFLDVPGGRRLRLGEFGPSGSPVFNAHGEVVALFSRRAVPDLGPVSRGSFRIMGRHQGNITTGFGTALSAVPEAFPDPPRRLAELAAEGVFVRPVNEDATLFVSGGIAAGLQRQNGVPLPVGQSVDFRRSQGPQVAFATVTPETRRQGLVRFRVWSLENHPVMGGDPVKLKAQARSVTFLSWPLRVEALPPGVYRLDLELDDTPIWRAYFRVAD